MAVRGHFVTVRLRSVRRAFHLSSFPEAGASGFEWRTYLDLSQDAHEHSSYLSDVLSGRTNNGLRLRAKSRMGRLAELLYSRNQVVEFVRARRMLQWLSKHFELRRIVLIVRHPCAVVSSMMDHRDWGDFREADSLDAYLGGTLPLALKEEVRTRLTHLPRNPAEGLALLWALDHFIPFHHFKDHGYPWTLVSYEALVADGSKELDRVFDELSVSAPEAAHDRLTTASGSASGELQVQNTHRQLSKWTRKLDGNQTDAILQIVEAFDLDFYTEDVEPDYDRLLGFQSEQSRDRWLHADR